MVGRHPEAISGVGGFPGPGAGLFHRQAKVQRLQSGRGHRNAFGRGAHRPVKHHRLPQCQGRLLPHVHLCGGLRGGSPVFSGPQERRVVPGPVCRGCYPHLPGLHLPGGAGPAFPGRLGRGLALRGLHHFGGNRGGQRDHQSTGHSGQAKSRLSQPDPGGLRG